MKKITLALLIVFFGLNAKAQSTIFEDGFENYTDFAIANVGNWTLTDLDLLSTGNVAFGDPSVAAVFPNNNVPKSFQVWNPSLVTVPVALNTPTATANWTSRTGLKSMICFYNISAPNVGGINNDWLISPQMTLGTSNTIKFWAKGCVLSDSLEKFNVWISTTNTAAPGSFTKISAGANLVTNGITWTEFTVTVPPLYDNTAVYIGIKCISDYQFALTIDDFKVTGTVACPAPTALTATVNLGALTANLSWTAGGAFSSEVKVQAAGAGTPAAANGTGVDVSATSYTTTPLIANTNYEFWVRDECTDGTLFSSWSGPFPFNTNSPPNCVTLLSPANAATAVNQIVAVPLTWTAAATGATATSYDVFLGTTAAPTTLAGNIATTTYNATGLAATTTYYWRVVAKNGAGAAVGCTQEFSFTTGLSAFSPYCGPVTFNNALEPITLVNFAGINKSYANTVVPLATAVHHKIFTDVATVAQGSTNAISLNGNTGGAYTVNFTVFIDWNQNNILDDAGEVYFGATPLTLISTTGLPATTPVVGSIVVPATATLGNTRMRVKKVFGGTVPVGMANPCISSSTGATYGEVHDYIVTVTLPGVATDTFTSTNFKSYPNPVTDILNLSYDKNITSIAVINILGQEVLSFKNNSTDAKIDMSSLTAGAYMVKISADNEVKTIKVIKE